MSFSVVGGLPSQAQPGGHAITYGGLRPYTDFVYAGTAYGYKESIVLKDPRASGRVTYLVEANGLQLDGLDDGTVVVRSNGRDIGTIVAPFAEDSNYDDVRGSGEITYDVSQDLQSLDNGRYHLTVEVPPQWLNDPSRRYPVVIDPTFIKSQGDPTTVTLLKDTYARETEETPQWDSKVVQVGNFSSMGNDEARSFLTFNMLPARPFGRFVYGATFRIFARDSLNGDKRAVDVHRNRDHWDDKKVVWGNQPPADTSRLWASTNACAPPFSGCSSKHEFNVKDLVQYWIDHPQDEEHPDCQERPNDPDCVDGSNHGMRLSYRNASTSYPWWIKFHSMETGSGKDFWPYLEMTINDIPLPKFADDAIPSGAFIKTDTPTLEIKPLNDANDDPIVVRYEVSEKIDDSATQADEFVDKRVYDSKWIAETTHHTVPSGFLKEEKKYFWRVRASDLCNENFADPTRDMEGADAEPLLCNDLNRDDYSSAPGPTTGLLTGLSSFTVTGVKRLGTDHRWAMSRFGLGNDMTLSVDQASGNLNLRYPVDSLSTGTSPLNVSLSYNVQAATGSLADADNDARGMARGWEISAGPSSSTEQLPTRLTELAAGGVVYGLEVVYESGRRDTFVPVGPNDLFGAVGPIASTIRRHAGVGYVMTSYTGGTYSFDSAGKLVKAKPSTSTASEAGFDYVFNGQRLTKVTDPSERSVTLTYGGSPIRLEEISVDSPGPQAPRTWHLGYSASSSRPLTSVTDAANDTVRFEYDANGALTKVQDGDMVASGSSAGTTMTYQTHNSRPWARTVTEAGIAQPWTFVPNIGSGDRFATVTDVTDPRGALTTTDPDDFETRTNFTFGGLPVRFRGPINVNGNRSEVRQLWDINGNMVCRRDATANAIQTLPCIDPGTTYPSPAHKMQTEYFYQKRRPFLLEKVVGPVPNADASGQRLVTGYAYDETSAGVSFTGLRAQYFDNQNLIGVPKSEAISEQINFSWPDGQGPTQLEGRSDNFSIRWFGEVNIFKDAADIDAFRANADDGARIVVGDKLVSNCWATDEVPECSQEFHKFDVGWVPMIVEFQELTGPAKIKLEWHRDPDNWEVIPAQHLRPNTDIPSSIAVGTEADPTAFSTTTYAYGGDANMTPDEAKLRGLASSETLTGGTVTPLQTPQKTDFTYDPLGRVRTEANATGKTISHEYGTGSQKFCETRTEDRTGLVTRRECNEAGDITREEIYAEGPSNPARVTTTVYDELGRVQDINYPEGGHEHFVYDADGHLKEEHVKVTATDTRITSYEYDLAGRLTKETLPDPDYALPESDRPAILHEYDMAGNETKTTDERTQVWIRNFDASNAMTSRKDPEQNEWSYKYDSAGSLTKKTDPTGVVVTRTYDVLGRIVTRRLGDLEAKRWDYNARGDLMQVTDPDQVYTKYDYDGAGRAIKETALLADPLEKSKHYTFNGSGFLTQVTDFKGEITTYGYDDMGRVTSVTLPHMFPNETTYHYNSAGELREVRLPTIGAKDPIKFFYTYDDVGRLKTHTDGVADDGAGDTTTYHYNRAGEQTQIEDPRGFYLFSDYDGLGRRTERRAEKPLGAVVSRETLDYDRAGNLTDANNDNVEVHVDYDAAARVDLVTVRDAATDAAIDDTDYTYTDHRLTSRSDAAGTTTFSYDIDPAVTPGSAPTGRLLVLKDPFTGLETTFAYTDAGRLADRFEPTGVIHDFTYDRVGRLITEAVTKDGAQLARFSHTYDFNSRVESRTQEVQGSTDNGLWDYDYDAAGRMVAAIDPQGLGFHYRYDGAGNRVEVEQRQGATTMSSETTEYNSASRPIRTFDTTTEQTITAYTHDAAGNLTGITGPTESWTFDYDPWGRQVEASLGSALNPVSTTYDYDALDRTISRASTITTPVGITLQSATEEFLYAGTTEEVTGTGLVTTTPVLTTSLVTAYAYAEGAPLTQRTQVTTQALEEPPAVGSPIVRFFGANPHGDVSYMHDLSGLVTATKSYDAWGEPRTETGEEATTPTKLGFQGDLTDADTGLVDMGARLYMPSLGRFTSQDPMQGDPNAPLTMNPYIYGSDDPITMIDPTGEQGCPAGADPVECGQPTSGNSRGGRSESGRNTGGSRALPANVIAANQDASCDRHYIEGSLILSCPIPHIQVGTIYGGLFINSARVEIPGPWFAGPDLRGDARGFNMYAGPSRYRVFFRLDTDEGVGFVQVNPTCTADGGTCSRARGDAGISLSSGEGTILLTVHARNSVLPFAPAIDAHFEFSAAADGELSLYYERDDYPSLEIYRSINGQILIETRRLEGSPFSLFPFGFGETNLRPSPSPGIPPPPPP